MNKVRRWRFLVGTAMLATAVMITGMPVADAAPRSPDPLEPPLVVPQPFVAPANGFDWSAPSRFGRDNNGDGITDYHWNDLTRPPEHDGPAETYDPAWVHPDSFPIDFDACPTAEEAARSDANQPTANTYTWVIDGTTHQPNPPDCRLAHSFPAEGTYSASLTITRPDGTTEGPHAQEVRVRDLLIVSIGDSYGSGEGNPDKRQVIKEDGTREDGTVIWKAGWVDKRCHRSADAGAAQAARRIEGSDPKTSVTFLSFACSGATIDSVWGPHAFDPYKPPEVTEDLSGTGVLGPYRGVEKPEFGPVPSATVNSEYITEDPHDNDRLAWPRTTPFNLQVQPPRENEPAKVKPVYYPEHLPSQLDQLERAIEGPDGSPRPIDSLVISGGGNDAGFGPLASVCVLELWNCMDVNVPSKVDPTVKIPLHQRLPQDVAALPGKYDQLNAALAATGIPVARTYVTEYPGSTTGDDGQPCKAMLDDVLRPNVNALLALTQVLGEVALLLTLVPVVGPVLAALVVVGGLLAVLWSQTRSMAGDEVVWAGNNVAPGINAKLDDAARRHRWTYVGGIGAHYVGHGYCAINSYIRRAPEASKLQGPWGLMEMAGIHGATTGTLHPNVTGHSKYADQIVPLLTAQFGMRSGSAEFTVVDRLGDMHSRPGWGGWLTGRCVTASGACTSDAAVVTVEARDSRGLKGAEFTVDGQPGCPAGMTCQATLVDPFTYRWTFTITGDGFSRLGFAVSSRFGDLSTFGHEVKVDLHDPTAAAALEAPTAPTGLRFEGDDGQGSGVHEIAFDGLWYGSAPGSTKPGNSVPIDLGGNYVVRFRAVDEAGRTGPWQTQNLTLGGPTMNANARSSDACSADGLGTTFNNEQDGRPVATSTSAHSRSTVNPFRRSLTGGAHAVWEPEHKDHAGRVFCSVSNRFDGVPLRIEPGSSGLSPGDPVTLTATVRLAGRLDGRGGRHFSFQPVFGSGPDDLDYTASSWFQTWLRVRSCDETNGCSSAVEFTAEAERDVYDSIGDGGGFSYESWLESNREPPQSDEGHQDIGQRAPASQFPKDTFTITFDAHVGHRYLLDGSLDISNMTVSNQNGASVEASTDASSHLNIEPAPGFEKIRLAYGDPQPNGPPDAVDDTAEVVGRAAVGVDVLTNDTDPDSDAMTVTEVSDPPHGTATVGANNRVTYTPDGNFPGRDSFTYTVSDGKGGTDTATVRISAKDATAPPGDFDGDGDTDVAVFRPPGGVWFTRDGLATQWGIDGDIPVPGDYDGDAQTDVAVFRPANGIWFVRGGPTLAWGTAGDIPVPGDYDGDGTTEMAVYRPSMGLWFVRDGATTAFGTDGDIPVPGDYDGDGTTDIAVFRPANGTWYVQGGPVLAWGKAGDIPVPGDYDGDGSTDMAVYRPSGGAWLVRGGLATIFGTDGDIPVPGDYDADGDTDVAVFRPADGLWFIQEDDASAHFGATGDVPLPLPDAIRRFSFPPL